MSNLSLDSFRDYFDVDEGVAVTIMKDGSYAFVAGRDNKGNTGTSFFPDKREGGNIGIIKDPLGDNPQLVGATRPIPGSLTNNVVLSGDDKYLIGSYPTLNLGGAAYVFDVEEMIKTIEALDLKANGEDSDELQDYWLDSLNRGEGSVAFDEGSKREATFGDLVKVPIDDINPDISVAADYEIIGGNWFNQFTYGVPEGTQRSPIGIGGNPMGLTSVSVRDVVELLPITETVENDSLKRTLNWNFKIKGEGDGNEDENNKLIPIDPKNVEEVNLYVSVFPEGQGLLPSDKWKEEWKNQPPKDYNPNRVLTAQWNPNNNNWTWKGGSFETQGPSLPQEFTLPDELKLTGGQTYHWAVEVVQNGIKNVNTREFKTPLGATGGSDTFSSVSILTGEAQGDAEYNQSIQDQIDIVARKIESADGLVMRYQSTSGNWEPVSYNQSQNDWQATEENISDHYGKPLVLLADWVEDTQPNILNSGFSEAAADSLFASMVQLDLENGGEVGNGNIIYDEKGNLNRSIGAVFNSPLSRGDKLVESYV